MRSRSLRRWAVRLALVLAVGAALGGALGAVVSADADDAQWGISSSASVAE